MGAIFVCKVFEDIAAWPNDKNLIKQIQFIDIDNFAFYTLYTIDLINFYNLFFSLLLGI